MAGQGGGETGDDAFGNQRIGLEGQVRPVLLMRAERQHGNCTCCAKMRVCYVFVVIMRV